MLESLRRTIGIQAARFHFRRTRDAVVGFAQAIPSARSMLLILPFPAGDETPLTNLLPAFRRRFKEENITVVTAGKAHVIERILPRSRVIAVAGEEVTAFFIPRQSVIDRVRARQYDLAVDLNLDFMLPSAYICKESSARVRVGFSRKHADNFFNFQVRLDPESRSGSAHDRLLNCLQMFFADEGV